MQLLQLVYLYGYRYRVNYEQEMSTHPIRNGQMGFLTMESFSGMLEGGEPILYQGQLVGAVGVSGVKSFEDAEIAQHAIQIFLTHVSNQLNS